MVGDFAAQGPTLLLLDDAKDRIPDDAGHTELAPFLETLLRAPDLHILLSTRWRVGQTRVAERAVRVPPMAHSDADALLRGALLAMSVFDPA